MLWLVHVVNTTWSIYAILPLKPPSLSWQHQAGGHAMDSYCVVLARQMWYANVIRLLEDVLWALLELVSRTDFYHPASRLLASKVMAVVLKQAFSNLRFLQWLNLGSLYSTKSTNMGGILYIMWCKTVSPQEFQWDKSWPFYRWLVLAPLSCVRSLYLGFCSRDCWLSILCLRLLYRMAAS